MSLSGDECKQPYPNDHMKLTNKSDNQLFKTYEIFASFAINHVTLARRDCSIDSVELLVAEKTKSYEKAFNPMFFHFINRMENKNTEILLQKIDTKKIQFIKVTNVKNDHQHPNYFYLETFDNFDSTTDKRRIHIFNTINEFNMAKIKSDSPLFGSAEDMQNYKYSIPSDMNEVVNSIQKYCLSHFVRQSPAMPRRFAQFLRKKPTSSQSVRRPLVKDKNDIKKELHRSSSTEYQEKYRPNSRIIEFKSRSIENLLQACHIGNFEKSSSAQLSMDDNDSIHHSQPEEDVYFYKFENVLQDQVGLKHFKNFLKQEVSSENINFWEAVNKFTELTDKILMKAEAQKIFINYMNKETNTQVNLEGEVVDKIREQLSEPSKDMFDVAKNHIYHLMKNDSYSRFIMSQHFNSWKAQVLRSRLKSTTSSSSLASYKSQGKNQNSVVTFFANLGSKQSRDGSRKSSNQTIDSAECSSPGAYVNYCHVTFPYDRANNLDLIIVPNKKISYILKKADKNFNEHEMIMFHEVDLKIIQFSENMSNLTGKKLVIEKSTLLRIGFVQNNMNTALYENIWFVVKCRSSICLSSALDPVLKRLQLDIGKKHCVIKEDNPKIKLQWESHVHVLHNSTLLLLEENIFHRIKITTKCLSDQLGTLWNKIMTDVYFQSTLQFDRDNLLDSRSEFFVKYKLEPRRVGFLTGSDVDRLTFNDQRGMFIGGEWEMPDFLKATSQISSNTNSKRLSSTSGGDSDFSYSELDENSDPCLEQYEFCDLK